MAPDSGAIDEEPSVRVTPRSATRNVSHVVGAIDFPPSTGGIQLYVSEMWGDGTVGTVTVFAPRAAGDANFDATFPGTVRRFPAGSALGAIRYMARISAELPRWLRGNHVFHVTNVLLAPAFVPYLPLLRGRLIAWTHALEMTHPKLQLPISLLLRNASHVVTVSEYSRALAIERGARPDAIVKISAGGDGLYRRFPNPSHSAFRARFKISPDDFVILTTGRLSSVNRYKGYDRAIEVAGLLLQRERRFRWIVIGGGEDLAYYRASVDRSGLNSHMQFVGEAGDEQLSEAYAGCDLFVLLSREEMTRKGIMAEGYGIVYVEANSYGKPSLGLRRGGVPDAIIHERTGLLVDRDDAASIADAIERLMVNDAARARFGEGGRERALGDASWGTARERMRDMVADLSIRH